MRNHVIIARCEGPGCTARVTLNTGDTLAAYDMLRRRGWIVHQWTMYGNCSEYYCSEGCLKRGLWVDGEDEVITGDDGVSHGK